MKWSVTVVRWGRATQAEPGCSHPGVSAIERGLSLVNGTGDRKAGGTMFAAGEEGWGKRYHQLQKERVACTVDCKEGHEERWPRGVSSVWIMPGFLHKQEEFGLTMEMARGVSNKGGHHQLWGVETLFWLQHGTWNEEPEWAAVMVGTDSHGRWSMRGNAADIADTTLCGVFGAREVGWHYP